MKGEKESIRNLLEIFDGLLEYLTEEISETASHNAGECKHRVNVICFCRSAVIAKKH